MSRPSHASDRKEIEALKQQLKEAHTIIQKLKNKLEESKATRIEDTPEYKQGWDAGYDAGHSAGSP
jgi:flagellar biosynthesis/type III secretory pathway protein FliH